MKTNLNEEKWQQAQVEFWKEVKSCLPLDKQALVDKLKKAISNIPTSKYDPEVIFHRSPKDVAKDLLEGGYTDLNESPDSNRFKELLKELPILAKFSGEPANTKSEEET